MTQQNKELNVREWLLRAQDDEQTAEIILKAKNGPKSAACFHSQQMAEKLLKAFIVANKGNFPKVHQLDLLLKLCVEIDAGFAVLKDDAILLSDYYMDTRYPGDYVEFSAEEAKKAFDAAIRIKDFVLGKVKF